jgi:heme-degrading monooxygenase HmoA
MDAGKPREIYTIGIWTIKSGKEKEFISAWTSFAKWTREHVSEAGSAYLVLDVKNPLRFISFGPWENENSIVKWRDSNEFKNFVTKVKDLYDEFQPNTLKVVSSTN